MTAADAIDDILENARTIAVVGLSRSPAKEAHTVPAAMQARGFRILPVHPFADELLGERVFRSLTDIDEPIDIVNVFRPGPDCPPFARDAVAVGARALWLQLGIVSPESAAIAATGGLPYVEDHCIIVETRNRDLLVS